MKLSIVIPVYNEEKTVEAVLKKLYSLHIPDVRKELIVVNDGSKDLTLRKIEKVKETIKSIICINHSTNKGKGSAVRSGIEHATGDYILIQDADLEYNPHDIPKLLSYISNKKAEVVYGTRLNRFPNFTRDERTLQFFIQYLGNRFLSLVASILYGQWITDMETGYKMFPKKALEKMKLRSRSFDFEPEITAKLIKRGYKILEVPISTNPRNYTEGKKLIALRDGPIALWKLIKYRFVD